MEFPLSDVFMLSLKEIVLRKVTVSLWNEPGVLTSIEKFSAVSLERYSDYSKEWRETVEIKVTDKLSKFSLPKSLVKQILLIVTPIGLLIKRWKGFHERYLEEILERYSIDSRVEFDAPILAKLCWTTAGNIDYRKTAEELICCEIVDIVKRYKLACLYCLEDYISVFWEELPEDIKSSFYNKEDILHIREPYLQFCWPYILKGEQFKLNRVFPQSPLDILICRSPLSFNQNAFKFAACRGNKAAAEYFFKKLTHKEKHASFLYGTVRSAVSLRSYVPYKYSDDFPSENSCDTMYYLLSQMNHEKQIQIFKEESAEVLCCFLDWPWQDLFLKIADLIWALLPARSYIPLPWFMDIYFFNSKYCFPKLFQVLFTRSPFNLKKMFVDQVCREGSFFEEFFDMQDSETIEVIFRNVDAVRRMKLVSCEKVFELFHIWISRDRWHMVEVCLREATRSKEDREKLKEAFSGFIPRFQRGPIQNSTPVWEKFLQLLDEIDAKTQNKRCLEDEILNKAKKSFSDE